MEELKGLQIALEMLKKEGINTVKIYRSSEGILIGFALTFGSTAAYITGKDLRINYKDKSVEVYENFEYGEQFSQEVERIMNSKKDELKQEFYKLLD